MSKNKNEIAAPNETLEAAAAVAAEAAAPFETSAGVDLLGGEASEAVVEDKQAEQPAEEAPAAAGHVPPPAPEEQPWKIDGERFLALAAARIDALLEEKAKLPDIDGIRGAAAKARDEFIEKKAEFLKELREEEMRVDDAYHKSCDAWSKGSGAQSALDREIEAERRSMTKRREQMAEAQAADEAAAAAAK